MLKIDISNDSALFAGNIQINRYYYGKASEAIYFTDFVEYNLDFESGLSVMVCEDVIEVDLAF